MKRRGKAVGFVSGLALVAATVGLASIQSDAAPEKIALEEQASAVEATLTAVFENDKIECLNTPRDGRKVQSGRFSLVGQADKHMHLYITRNTPNCIHDHVLKFFDVNNREVKRVDVHPYTCGGSGLCAGAAFIDTILSYYDYATISLVTYFCFKPTTETLHWTIASGANANQPDWTKRDFSCQGGTCNPADACPSN
jgi:hypothetical protein